MAGRKTSPSLPSTRHPLSLPDAFQQSKSGLAGTQDMDHHAHDCGGCAIASAFQNLIDAHLPIALSKELNTSGGRRTLTSKGSLGEATAPECGRGRRARPRKLAE
jgi:hypothetical protein